MGVTRIADLSALWEEVEPHGCIIRLLIDHPDQLKHLVAFEEAREKHRNWSVYVKIDTGGSK